MRNIIIAILICVALLAGFLLYIGDSARLLIQSTDAPWILNFEDINISWREAIVVGVIVCIGLIIFWTAISWLIALPARLKSGVGLRRRAQALEAMEEALIAGAEGDASRARKKAERARSLISTQALGQIISAQAAEASGDTEEAITQYRALLAEKRTESTGRRGLAQQYLATGNLASAIEHAKAEYEKNKNARWAFDILFQAQLSDYRWKQASETLALGQARKHIDNEIARRRMAVLDTAAATQLEDDGDIQGAIDMAQKALGLAPNFAPAAALAARLYGKEGQKKKAISVLEKAWNHAPHPALSAAFLDLIGEESDRSRAKKIAHFIRQNPDHRESILLQVEENLRDEDAVTAWTTLDPLLQEGEPSARLCLLAAESETLLSNEKDAKVWAIRAGTAPSEPDWSDLDPEGDAFDYAAQDWRRLVYSFGEKGELIHPRFEQGAPKQAVTSLEDVIEEQAADKLAENENSIKDASDILESDAALENQEELGDIMSGEVDKDDLAMRLDSLLDDKPKNT
ncbi:MAG: tetratricopeptide repeat protein [Hellea sp.]|nr:tetratricopeptide repeat protein [Hellea sp.]